MRTLNQLKEEIRYFYNRYKAYPNQLIMSMEDYEVFCRVSDLPMNRQIIIPVFDTFRKFDESAIWSVREEVKLEDALTEKREELVMLDICIMKCEGWLLTYKV